MKKRLLLLAGPVFLILLVAGWFLAENVASSLVEGKLQGVLTRVADKAQVRYASLHVDLLRQQVVLGGVEVQLKDGRACRIKSLAIKDIDRKHTKPPHHLSLFMEDLTIPVTEENFRDKLEEVQEFGLDVFVVDLTLDYRFDPDAKRLTINALDVVVDNGATLELAMDLDGFDLEALRKQQLGDLTARSLKARMADTQLLRGGILKSRRDEPQLMDFVIEGFLEEQARARTAGDDEKVENLNELVAWLREPTRIDVRFHLREPLTWAKLEPMKKITDILELFDFDVTRD